MLDGVAAGRPDVAASTATRSTGSPTSCASASTGIEPQAVLLGLDQAGIAAHSGSACASEDLLPSPVLEAMGVDAHHSLRISIGWSTTDADIDALLDALPVVLDRLRALAGGG